MKLLECLTFSLQAFESKILLHDQGDPASLEFIAPPNSLKIHFIQLE